MDVRPRGRGGRYRIADFICPTEETRAAFSEAFTIWVDRISAGLSSDAAICLIIPCSSAPTLSNNIIQKGLAFGRDWSGSVVNSGR